ncbi:rhodanese-like domain-containing protein [Lutibacter citreus]|uniref:rhodanese-like domain-containing protein n=1 Tax=Lutibacter citreus TaxID=2138210 RepID=UPI000DBEA155|nr:rhodanese-like domain-containing protein [Lutibacter citreus]
MKELEKTKNISIAAVITILLVIIALLAYKKPKHLYAINTKQALKQIVENPPIQLNNYNPKTAILIDIRNQYEYEKGHIENAINIHSSDILDDANSIFFKKLKEDNKSIVLYGNEPSEAISASMILHQLGYSNVKILAVNNSLNQDKLITTPVEIEKKGENINQFIKASIKKVNELSDVQIKPKPIKVIPKKVIPIKKKKKMPTEGGC